MINWVDVGEDAVGVVAIGGRATGVVAIGQLATGVIAIGQLARGVVVVGQLAFGVVVVGQLALGVGWAAGMVGMAARSPGWFVLPLLGAPDTPLTPTPRRVVGGLVAVAIAIAWWLLVGAELLHVLLADGGILAPERQLR